MHKIIFVNTPVYFTVMWAMVKPLLAKETAAKADILGANYQEVLLRDIPAENLPEELGGTCTCAGLGGCRLSGAGPWMEGRKERRARWLRGDPLDDNKTSEVEEVAVAENDLQRESALPKPVLVEA